MPSDILARAGRVSPFCVSSACSLTLVKLLWAEPSWAWNQHFCISDYVQAFPFLLDWAVVLFLPQDLCKGALFLLVWCIKLLLSAHCVRGPIFSCGNIWINFRQFCFQECHCLLGMKLRTISVPLSLSLLCYSWQEMIHYHSRSRMETRNQSVY